MAGENGEQDVFGSIDLNMFNEASEFIMGRQEELPEEELENEDIVTKEVEEEESEEEVEKKTPSSQETTKDSFPLTPYFKLLVEEGEFSNEDLEKWDGTAEGIVDLRHKKTVENWEKYKSEALDPRVKWLQDNLEQGVALEELLKLDKESNALESITEESLETNEEVQKNIAREYYKKTTKFSNERIERAVKLLEDSGELKNEVKTFFEDLKQINEEDKTAALENARQEKLRLEKQEKEILTNFKTTLDGTNEVIPGLKVTSVMKDKIFKTLTTAIEIDEQSGIPINKIAKARIEDPIGFEIKLAYLFELTNGFKDWESLTVSGKKQAFKNFEEAAKTIDSKSSGSKHPEISSDLIKDLEFISKRL